VTSGHDYRGELAFALEIARAAGAATLAYFQGAELGAELKGDGSDVTRADREAEQLLRERIRARFPDDGILGEEHGEEPGASGRRWVLDPIDGTFSFVHGVPLYCNLVALEDAGRAVVGVCNMPALGEAVTAARGAGATWHRDGRDPVPARVSSTARLADATVCFTGAGYFHQMGHGELLARLFDATRRTRGWGDGYAFLLVATGRADAAVEPGLHPWDYAPFVPILEEAGGRFTDFEGRPFDGVSTALAANRALHAELLALATDSGAPRR
jgi:histidinol phosphatase-like enzyme (inositol monophosphatase family)